MEIWRVFWLQAWQYIFQLVSFTLRLFRIDQQSFYFLSVIRPPNHPTTQPPNHPITGLPKKLRLNHRNQLNMSAKTAFLSSSLLLTLFFPIFSMALPQSMAPKSPTSSSAFQIDALPTQVIQATIKSFQFENPTDEILPNGLSPQIKGHISLTLTDTRDKQVASDCSTDLSLNEITGNHVNLTSLGQETQFGSVVINKTTIVYTPQDFSVPIDFFPCGESHFNFWFMDSAPNSVTIGYSHT
jgi:hypothetical protein